MHLRAAMISNLVCMSVWTATPKKTDRVLRVIVCMCVLQ